MTKSDASTSETAINEGVSLTAIVTAEGDGQGLADLVDSYLVALEATNTSYEVLISMTMRPSGSPAPSQN